MAELDVSVNREVESDVTGCHGNYYEGVNPLSPTEATVHGVIEDMGNAEEVEVEFQAVEEENFDGDPNSDEDWEDNMQYGGITAQPDDPIITTEGEEFEATFENLSPCTIYYFRIKVKGT